LYERNRSLSFSAVRGCNAIQEPFVGSPRKLMPCLLPVRFALSSRLRVFGLQTRLSFITKESQALRSLLAHLLRLSPDRPAESLVLVRAKPSSSAPRVSLRSLQHVLGHPHPSFHSLERLKEVGLSLRSSLLRVWLPSRGLGCRVPRKPLSAPNALGISPSELSSTGRSKKRSSLFFFRPCAFFQPLLGVEPALRRFALSPVAPLLFCSLRD
jgi:hypothetical protein